MSGSATPTPAPIPAPTPAPTPMPTPAPTPNPTPPLSIMDNFGRIVTQRPDGSWAAYGVAVGPTSAAVALNIFNGQPPPGFTAPTITLIPQSITNYQARSQLRSMPSAAGGSRTLFDDVDAAVHAMGGDAVQAWEYANIFVRDGTLVSSIGAGLGMTAAQMDAFFVAATDRSA